MGGNTGNDIGVEGGGAVEHADNGMTASSKEQQQTGLAEVSPAEKRQLKSSGRLQALSDLVWILQAWLIATVIAALVTGDGAAFFLDFRFPLAELLAVTVLAVLRMRLTLASSRKAMAASRAVKTRVRDQLLQAISAASPASPLPSSGEVAAHIGDQVDALGPYLLRFYPQKVRLAIVPAVIVLAVLPVSWLVALILLVAGPVIPVFMAMIGMRAKSASERQQAELTRMSGFLLDRIKGLETLRLFGAAERTKQQIDDVGDAFRRGTMKVLRIAFLSSTVLELFSALGIAAIAIYVGVSLLGSVEMGAWGSALSFRSGLFVLLLAPEFFSPLRAYAAAYHDRAAGLAATEKLSALHSDICSRSERPSLDPKSAGARHIRGDAAFGMAPEITLQNVGLTLGGRAVLSDVSLTVGSGDKVLLVGPSGAGKTTILDCLLGLHRPETGRILVGGTELWDLDIDTWRARVAWISQSPRLFHGSLKANLLRANPRASETDLWAALEMAGATRLVERLPRGLGTIVGEDGFGLSVGEARRIALARAAVRHEAVLVVADEPTAGLDAETAADVIAGLERMADGRTFVAATHDARLMAMEARRIALSGGKLDAPATAKEGVA